MIDRLTLGQLADRFDNLLETPVEDRTRVLDLMQLAAEDRARLVAMLRADARAEHWFLDEPALVHAQALGDHHDRDIEPNDLIGQQFGAFRLDAFIGQGGMATVFLAHRTGADFEQAAAVKLLRRGLFSATEQQMFRRERRLLAQLTHPNIARLIDGGVTAGGIPYLVLEHVEGMRLDRYVEENGLDLRARLELFVRASRAVEAAHQALIVHRDIKPSNILVTADGEPKLLDFGVAKLLEDEGAGGQQTLTAALTPGYAAPEQLVGGQITTATDVYALGVVLHELLTGHRPRGHERATTASAADPATASGGPTSSRGGLPRVLRGDLENIVRHALEDDPRKRYATATALIEDVESYLEGRPVRAHPPSRVYVVRKFLHRNRLTVSLVAALSLAILGSLAGALWQARATRLEAHRANSVRDFLLDLFGAAEERRPKGAHTTPEDVVELGARRVLADNSLPASSKAELVHVLATVASSMGVRDPSAALTQAGLALADESYARDDARWIASRKVHADALNALGRHAEAIELLLPLREELLRRHDAMAYETLLTLLEAMDKAGGAQADGSIAFLRSIREQAEAEPHLPASTVFHVMIAEVDQLAAKHLFKESLERADIAERHWRAHELPLTSEVLWLYEGIGNSASSLGDAVRGEAAYRSAISLSERIHDRPHADTAWFVGLLGSYLVSLGRLEEAEPYVLRGLEMRRELLGETDPSTLFAAAALSRLRAAQGRQPEAVAVLDEAIAACRRADLRDDACVRLLQTRGRIHSGSGQFAQAKSDLEAAIALQREVSGDEGPAVASPLVYLSELLRRMKRYEEALGAADNALALMERSGGGHWGDVAVARLQRAWSNLELGRPQQALDEMQDAEPRLAKESPGNVKTRMAMMHVAVRALAQLGEAERARAMAREALALGAAGAAVDGDVVASLRRFDVPTTVR